MANDTKKKTSSSARGAKTAKGKTPSRAKKTVEAGSEVAGQETQSAARPERKSAKANTAVKRPRLIDGTFMARPGQVTANWRIIDAAGLPLGRLSTYIAMALMGKDKPSYTRSSDTGDHVIVINAKQIVLTGKKYEDKLYKYHTNYPGGLKTFTARQILEGSHPERVLKWSVYGMLPKGHMGRHWYKKLRVYPGADHPHTAQQPKAVTLPNLGFTQKG